ncbi:S8 family peptidase [Piscinibacter sp.]|uniref:S8 family peptidase n=1 Tax=Piscinibacter sp. TaxID=1903157 RepID=UPI0039E4583E
MKSKLPRLALALSLLVPLAATAADAAPTARVIVKFKADSTALRKQVQSATQRHEAQAAALGSRLGLALGAGRGVGENTQVVFAAGLDSDALAARLSREADVEYAVPDRRKQRAAAPNDPLYGTGPALNPAQQSGGPVAGQWYLRAPDPSALSAINAEAAWSVPAATLAPVVVAVLDTGVRFDHPDLAGKLLPGYDMVGDVPTANDGDGRDSDPSDPGDFLTQADIDTGNFDPCTSEDISGSSWHGTQVSGIIGAATDNGIGMAGVGRERVRVLPVRVLGKCGGFDADILAGMRWAAGITVDGLTNPNPAKVLNLSLGGSGACSSAYRDAVAQISARGVVIVASAGNGAGHAVSEPANCSGVIGVGGLRHEGDKVGYSDIGPELSLSAPAGNCVTASGACLYPILTTANSGAYDPVAGSAGAIYTDAFNATVGTSFSAPLVAGTAALMLSVKPELTPAQLRQLLMRSARPFPVYSDIANCRAPDGTEQDQCNCTTSTCGAGMLDADAAVRAAAGVGSGGGSGGGGGGGALGLGWLAGLAGAVWSLRRTRRGVQAP